VTRIFAINLGAAALTLALSASLGLGADGVRQDVVASAPSAAGAPEPAIVTRGSERGLLDASGEFVPIGAPSRVAATSLLANDLLLSLCEPDRIVALARPPSDARATYRYAGKPALSGAADIETLLRLHPDLVLVNAGIAGEGHVARLREAGLHVFDLGPMRGLGTVLPNIRNVAALLGRPDAGRELAHRLEFRMRALARSVPESARADGMYVALYGDALSGGTAGTSYHDVLHAAGVRDIAARLYRDWPRYTPEALLALDPELIVTHRNMGHAICALPGVQQVRACRNRRVIELDPALLADPGLGMFDAAESLFQALHP
jgi:iron complex transport system substrate-binding protein